MGRFCNDKLKSVSYLENCHYLQVMVTLTGNKSWKHWCMALHIFILRKMKRKHPNTAKSEDLHAT